MKTLATTFVLIAVTAAAANAQVLLNETFSGGSFDNPDWVTWHAPWGNNPTVNLAGDQAAINAGGNGSAGIAILVDISAYSGQPITLSGEWAGTANGTAWVETMFYQTNDPDMTDLTSANFATYDAGGMPNIALKHDSFGLPNTVWGPQSFSSDAVQNGASEGFTAGLTQTATMDYVVLAFKTGNDGQITNLDNLTVSAPPVPEPSTFALAALGIVGLGACAWRFRRRQT